MTKVRVNEDREDGFSFGHSRVHDAEDNIKTLEKLFTCFSDCQSHIDQNRKEGHTALACAQQLGCITVGVVAVVAVIGGAVLAGAGESSSASSDCWEICHTRNGISVCECIFGN